MYTIAVFRSRKESLDLQKKLEYKRVKCSIINTPRKASIGCGISVKFDSYALDLAKYLIRNNDYDTFIGLYEIIDNRVSKLY